MNNNPHFEKFVHLLLELHHLMANDEDDERGEKIRDRMDVEWNKLSEDEVKLSARLSEDLYSIGENREQDTLSSSPMESEKIKAMTQAFKNQEWYEMLGLLREVAPYLKADRVSYIRGRAWEKMALPEAALEFYYESIRINPDDIRHYICILGILLGLKKYDDVYQAALKAQALPGPHIQKVYVLSMLLMSMSMIGMIDHGSMAEYADRLRTAINLALDEEHIGTEDNTILFGCYTLMVVFDFLGRKVDAGQICELAHKLAPENPYVLLMRGMHYFISSNDRGEMDIKNIFALPIDLRPRPSERIPELMVA